MEFEGVGKEGEKLVVSRIVPGQVEVPEQNVIIIFRELVGIGAITVFVEDANLKISFASQAAGDVIIGLFDRAKTLQQIESGDTAGSLYYQTHAVTNGEVLTLDSGDGAVIGQRYYAYVLTEAGEFLQSDAVFTTHYGVEYVLEYE